ncbi:MAG: hypothetical protein K6T94_18420 [Paenibacillus sp.]|nr:hypothetical protein [Paenibacillus sp.]
MKTTTRSANQLKTTNERRQKIYENIQRIEGRNLKNQASVLASQGRYRQIRSDMDATLERQEKSLDKLVEFSKRAL